MDISQIAEKYDSLSEKQQHQFGYNFSILLDQSETATALNGPYRFILDSNIIMRFEDLQHGRFQEGLLSVLLFFNFLKTQSVLLGDLIITPVVFYEFYRLQNVTNLKEYWTKFKSIRSLVEDTLEVDVRFENLESFEKTEHFIKSIEADCEVIKERLIYIEKQKYKYDFLRSPGGVTGVLINNNLIEVAPISAADDLYIDIETKYFNPYYVSLFLKDHMAYKLSTNPDNDLSIAKKYHDDYLLRKVVFLDNNKRVKGLADIDLFSKCNIKHQFDKQAHGTYFPASVPLTIDKHLFLSLRKYSTHGISSEQIIGGESSESISAKLESSFDDARRFDQSDKRRIEYAKQASKYLELVSKAFKF